MTDCFLESLNHVTPNARINLARRTVITNGVSRMKDVPFAPRFNESLGFAILRGSIYPAWRLCRLEVKDALPDSDHVPEF